MSEDILTMETDVDGIDLSFELVTSDDGLLITLECRSEQPLSPDEYAQALTAFLDYFNGYANSGNLN